MENYLMLNGKRIDLTKEQIRTLGLEVKEDYKKDFERYGDYYYIGATGDIFTDFESERANCKTSEKRYNAGNYCKDEVLIKQRALHEVLDRLLWRFSMENDGDKIDRNNSSRSRFYIYFNLIHKEFRIESNTCFFRHNVYFYSMEVAQRALNEIVLPFIENHPEFVW